MQFLQKYNIALLSYTIFVALIFFVAHFLPPFFIHIPLLLAFIPISWQAGKKLLEKKIGTEFFLTFATIISLIGDQERAMTIILLIMLFAQYLESLIAYRTHQEIQSLIKLIPQTALVIIDGKEKSIALKDIEPDTLIIIKTGGRIPIDGTIISGAATINEASLTGESTLQEKHIHAQVFAGTFVEAGSITVKTAKVGKDTFFGKIITLVEKSEEKKAKVSILADTIAFYLVPSLLLFIVLVWIITNNIQLVTTLLVFGSPLELTLITPLAILAGIIAAFKQGVLVKGGLALEKFSKADTIIFDKTGTLTMGEPTIVNIHVIDPRYSEKEVITIAAIAEKRSDHVLAKAVLKKAHEMHINVPDPEGYSSLSGHGVHIMYKNQRCFLGNKHFIEAPEHGNIKIPENLTQKGTTPLSLFYLGCGGTLIATLSVADTIRAEAQHTVDGLKKTGIKKCMLLSGDQQPIAAQIAARLHIQEARGEVFPDQKLTIIEDLQKKGHIIAMVGDGINDAPALKQADIGIALGAMGMEPAIEAADIVLSSNDLSKIIFVRALSQKIFKVIIQNIVIGFFIIHAFGFFLAFMSLITPIQAALFHAVPDIAILLNSARLANFKISEGTNS